MIASQAILGACVEPLTLDQQQLPDEAAPNESSLSVPPPPALHVLEAPPPLPQRLMPGRRT